MGKNKDAAPVDDVSAARNALTMLTSPMPSPQAQAIASAGLLSATLALVEQQRIANLIAFLGTRSPSPETQGRIRDEIRKGLGL